MKKIFLTAVLIIILLLAWAASDDITTGNEPSFIGEYVMVLVSLPLLLILGMMILGLNNIFKK